MSAINRLIDQACGVPADYKSPYTVRMECRKCSKTCMVKPAPIDPPGTVKIVITCPDCQPDGEMEVENFNAQGEALKQ